MGRLPWSLARSLLNSSLAPHHGFASVGARGLHSSSASLAAERTLPAGLIPGQANTTCEDNPPYTAEMPTTSYVMEALEHVTVDPGVVKAILHPDRELTVTLPVTMDSGEVEQLTAHLVQHNNDRGPFKGGLVYHQDVTIEGLRSLSALNTWKTALMDVPFGGCKLGVAIDPRMLSEREKEKVTRRLVTAIYPLLGPNICVPAPDIGTDEKTMAHIFDQYSRIRGFSPGVVSGKPTWLHGCEGRDSASGRGSAMMTREFLRKVMKTRIDNCTFIVQGFGKNGAVAAEMLHEQGGKVIGVASSETAVYNAAGLDIKALRAHMASGKYLAEFPEGEPIANDDSFLAIPCDVVVLAAVNGTINSRTAPTLQCGVVMEGSNAGITVEGNKILAARGIKVCPDLLTSGGGVVVSYMEYKSNMNNLALSLEEVVREQERYMTTAFRIVYELARDRNISIRTAAYCVALQRISRAGVERGLG